MPTYVYRCNTCEEDWEESFPYEERDKHVGEGCIATSPCDGTIERIPAMPGFAYDNIKAGNSAKAHKPPGWMKDKLKEIKRQQPGATMGLPF
tara:strand:+ start:219 stop:494 length:276 start_codon:yes stop_codon:yes gene_type:complete